MKILVLGHSSIAQRRAIPAMTDLANLEIIDLASSRPIAEEAIPASHRGSYYDSYEEALSNSDAELVYVTLQNSAHEEWVEKTLDGGKSVVVDKPAFLSYTAATRLVGMAKAKGLCLAEATVFTCHPQIELIKQAFSEMGGPRRVSASFSIPPLPLENFRNHKEFGGGAFWDLCPYAVATSRVFFEERPVSLHARQLSSHSKTGVDMAFSMMATYGNGKCFLGHYGFDTEYINQITLFGPKCSVFVDRFYTPPPDLQNEITVRRENKSDLLLSDSGDSFGLFFEKLIADIKSGNAEVYSDILMRDALLTRDLQEEIGL